MIKLSDKGIALLRQCLYAHNPSLIPHVESCDGDSFTDEFYNKLRDIVGTEFCERGLQPDDEPNEYGLELEALIDEIGRLFMFL